MVRCAEEEASAVAVVRLAVGASVLPEEAEVRLAASAVAVEVTECIYVR